MIGASTITQSTPRLTGPVATGEAQLLLYEATDNSLERWDFRRVLISRPADYYAARALNPVSLDEGDRVILLYGFLPQ